ncbi:MFS transporter [Singulisphaera sp. PoT]|uniref:MFS transporter n=1 Tax=Singulisphaera sp. PoT TaxID=3411797 RepID=UPI003BF5837C
MTTHLAAPSSEVAPLGRRHALAAFATFLVLITVYQTLVLTAVTDDVIRKGIEADEYDMIWTDVAWGVPIIFSLFGAFRLSGRLGMRISLAIGLASFALGNLLCGAAGGLPGLVLGRFVEGIGKGLTIAIGRASLYKQFDRRLLVAIGFYGVCAYATRPLTPLVTAYINEAASWRWIYWINVPIALGALAAVLRFDLRDRPVKPVHVPLDWLAIAGFSGWVVCLMFAFKWYRKWGGWTSDAFAVVAILCVVLPILLALWLGSGFSPDEHLRRLLRSRVYVLAMMARLLLLLNLGAVLAIVARYLIELRGEPRVVAGWILAPASLSMTATTLLTTVLHRRGLRHAWLFVAVAGSSGCLWWLSPLDNFTAKEHVAVVLACWGAFLGLLPPVFLCDEVEGASPQDMLYAGSLGAVCLIVPLLTVPALTGTAIKAWSDRGLDVYRANLREGRPAVAESAARISDHFRQRGLAGAELQRETSTVLGTFVVAESVALGFRQGFRFLSLVVLAIGSIVAVSLAWASRDLRAPPGSGYS